MSLTLYRKYRPQTFAELIGQNHIKTTLQSELINNTLAHAYLFSGPRGLGKTTTARLLAKAVNCLKRKQGSSEPCNACPACDEITRGNTLDVVEIDAASHTGVDNVRENIIEHSRFAPTSRHFKVFIIDEVHMLSTSAFNALLKTLEEPPAHVIFILATTELHKVPETIISRCQHFDFRRVPIADIIVRLESLTAKEKKTVDASIIESVAYRSQGCLRDAESMLGQILSLGDKRISIEQAELVLPRSQFDAGLALISAINKRELASALSQVYSLSEDGVNLETFVDDIIILARRLLYVKVSGSQSAMGALPKHIEEGLQKLAETVTLSFVQSILEAMITARQRMKSVDIMSLPLELALARLIGEPDDYGNDQAGSGGTKLDEGKTKSEIVEPSVPKLVPHKPESTKPTKAARREISTTIDQVRTRWNDVLTALRIHNQSLASALKIGHPTAITDNGDVVISFEHDFHQKRLNEDKTRTIISSVLTELFGESLSIQTVRGEVIKPRIDSETKDRKKPDELNSIIQTFGGQLIE